MRERLVACAREYLDTPFHHCGRTLYGVDCVGLILAAARDAGLMDWAPPPYSRQPDPALLIANIQEFCDAVQREPEAGDVLLFEILGVPRHVGLCTGPLSFIHAYQSAGRVVEHALDEHWRRRLLTVYEWRALPSLP